MISPGDAAGDNKVVARKNAQMKPMEQTIGSIGKEHSGVLFSGIKKSAMSKQTSRNEGRKSPVTYVSGACDQAAACS